MGLSQPLKIVPNEVKRFFSVPVPVEALYLNFSREVLRKMEQYKHVMSSKKSTVKSVERIFFPSKICLFSRKLAEKNSL